MTFDKAYCQEFNGNITAYKARREYFAQDDTNYKFTFFCPDENCNVELTSVNIYTAGIFKHKPHFRTKKNCNHSSECSIINDYDKESKSINKGTTSSSEHGQKINKYPDEFILKRPKCENQNKIEQTTDDDFDIEPRQKRESVTVLSNNAKPHATSYLENVVDSYEDMDEWERNRAYITLNNQRRTYYNTFKKVQYFEDGENFIFYGEIEPIKPYGKNYSITFKDKVWINKKPYQINMYITNESIKKYRLSRLFQETINTSILLGNNLKNTKCYFVGSYPKIKKVLLKDGKSFTVYEVVIENLDHLVIKFEDYKNIK
jgi:hypothetical protein